MPLSHSERKEKHYGFMCAALIAMERTIKLGDLPRTAALVADYALAAFEARWEGEEK